MLNDPQIVEASRFFGERLYKKNEGKIDAVINEMFTEAIGRKPSDKESNLMSDLFREQKENFSNDKESAKNYLSIGDKAYDPNIPVEDIAALGVLATAIFNLWESMAKF